MLTFEHRYEQALTLAERSVVAARSARVGHGLAVALATLGQICVRLGDLGARRRRCIARSRCGARSSSTRPTGAVYDTLAQIHLIQGNYEAARDCLERAREAYGAYGRQTSQWYDWSVRVLFARLALRRGALDEAVSRADETSRRRPAFDALQATLIAAEALASADRLDEAETRLATAADQLDPRTRAGHLGRVSAAARHSARAPRASIRGVPRLRAKRARCSTCLASAIWPHSAISPSAVSSRETGARSVAERHLDAAAAVFQQLGADARCRRHRRRAGAADRRRHRRKHHRAA